MGASAHPARPVRGPGTSTSDSIDIKASDGEFMLPADTVRKVGIRRLQDLVTLTHEPSGNRPRAGHYADGGLVGDITPSKPKREDYVGNAFSAMNQQRAESVAAGQAAAASALADAEASAGRANAERASTPSAPPSGGLQGVVDRVSQIPTGGTRPAPAADGSQSSMLNTETGRNLSNIAAALPAAGTMLRAGRMVGSAAQSAGVAGEVGALNAGGAALRSMALPAAGAAAMAGASGAEPQGARERLMAAAMPAGAGRGFTNPPSVNPSAPAPSAPPAASPPPSVAGSSDITRTGNSYSGPANISGDVTINGAAPRNGGQVSAQNMAAADALAGRQERDARSRLIAAGTGTDAAATGVPQVAAPIVRHSGNDWQSRNDLRNLEVSASSIKNLPEWQSGSSTQAWSTRAPQVQTDPQGKIAMHQRALAADIAKRGAQPAFDMKAAEETAANQRTGMEQQGANVRASYTAASDAARNQIDRSRLALEQTEAGFKNRSAERQEAVEQAVLNAKTPADQRSARDRLMALAGKARDDQWKPVALQGGTDAAGNRTESILGAVNERTGEMRRMDQGGSQRPTPTAGAISMLRGNPRMAAQFDQFYGAGAARRALGG